MAHHARAQYHLSKRVYAAVCLVCIIIFALVASIASKKVLISSEVTVLDAINGWPDNLRPFFLAVTQIGNAWILFIVPFIAYVNKQRVLARHLVINGVSAFLLVEITKVLVDRPRPIYLHSGIHERELFVTGSGFPSGHTAMTTALALTLLPYLPRKYWWLLAVWILAVAVSRIYLGVHAPLDIIGGFTLGAAVVAASHLWDLRVIGRKSK